MRLDSGVAIVRRASGGVAEPLVDSGISPVFALAELEGVAFRCPALIKATESEHAIGLQHPQTEGGKQRASKPRCKCKCREE